MTNDLPKVGDPKPGVKDPSAEWPFYTQNDIDKMKKRAAEQQADAKDAAPERNTMTNDYPPLPFAVFDEFGKGADDRIQDHIRAAIAADRAKRGEAAPEGWQLVPNEADDALLRPFYECPPDELRLAWSASLLIASNRLKCAAAPKEPT